MSNGKKPNLIVYTVTGEGDNAFWTRIGAAWKNAKGGFNVRLNALPVNGTLVLLPPKADDKS